jgi:putative acetyltransferase
LYDLGMFLLPDFRGHGVGSALVERAIEIARERQAYKITLQVWPHNEAAIRLYEKFGFEREGYLRSHWPRQNGEIWDTIVMGLVFDG